MRHHPRIRRSVSALIATLSIGAAAGVSAAPAHGRRPSLENLDARQLDLRGVRTGQPLVVLQRRGGKAVPRQPATGSVVQLPGLRHVERRPALHRTSRARRPLPWPAVRGYGRTVRLPSLIDYYECTRG